MNKEYKLLRDLPNAKAGEIFQRDNYGDLIFKNQDSVASRGVIAFTDGEIKLFDILNPEKGWFEEIEERMKGFEEGELFVYINGGRAEIGKVKRKSNAGDAYFCYYSSGETAASTPVECMYKLVNNYTIKGTTLGEEK